MIDRSSRLVQTYAVYAVAVEEQQHEQRPQGPTQTAVIPSPSVREAAAATALVAAPDVPGQVNSPLAHSSAHVAHEEK